MMFSLALLAALPARADTEVAGVTFPATSTVGATELQLNGAGIRSRLMFKVYAIGLYVPERTGAADALLTQKGAKRIHLVTLRELTAEQLAEALVSALEKNNDERQLAALHARIDEFRTTMLSLGSASKGAVIDLDFLPQGGTRLQFNGAQKGRVIPGEDFYNALLRIWIGDNPVQKDLKDALLGKR